MNLNTPPLRSLKTRVTVLTLIIFLTSLWSVTYYAQHSLRDDMQHLLSNQQQSTAAFVAKSVNDEMSDRIRALEILATKITTPMMKNPARLQAMLEDRKADFSLFNNGIAVAGVDGTVIAEYPPLPGRLGASFAERDYMVGPLKQGKMTIGRPVMSKLMHAPAFVIGMPILDPQGTVVGVLGGSLTFDCLIFWITLLKGIGVALAFCYSLRACIGWSSPRPTSSASWSHSRYAASPLSLIHI